VGGMKKPEPVLPLVNLAPGDLYVSREPTVVSTVLGSCVAVCLHSPRHEVGAICHGILPRGKGDRSDCGRFVDCALEYMLNDLYSRFGVESHELVAKLFGGAMNLSGPNGRPPAINVGDRNIDAARKTLQRHRLQIAAEQVGGGVGRRLLFFTHTGRVLLKRLSEFGGGS